MKSHTNLSYLDSILRIVGAILWAGIWGAFINPLAVLALYPMVTGMAGYDPIYAMRGFSTAEPEAVSQDDTHNHTSHKRAA